MPPLNQAEKDALIAEILQKLSHTPYSCSSLTGQSSGTSNFVFRGILDQPLQLNGQDENAATSVKTVIVKHSTPFAAVNKDFPLDVSRCHFEELMLNALTHFPATTTADNISIRPPHLYIFLSESNTQIIQDVPNSIDLKEFLISPTANSVLDQRIATSLGYAMGSWLRTFHDWALAPAQAELRREIGKSEAMRKLKAKITYTRIIEILQYFPDLLQGRRKALEEVEALGASEFEKNMGDDMAHGWGIIHGDFWTGNVLIPESLSPKIRQSQGISMFIIDWEYVQFGPLAYDYGQMIADFCERKHFNGADCGMWAIQGFTNGYGPITDDMAFRIAIHTGVTLVCWFIRRPIKAPLPFPREQVKDLLELGAEFIVKGWKKDKRWFEDSPLACLFKTN